MRTGAVGGLGSLEDIKNLAALDLTFTKVVVSTNRTMSASFSPSISFQELVQHRLLARAVYRRPVPGGQVHVLHHMVNDPAVRSVALGYQSQITAFFASDSEVVIHPEPSRFFETPIAGSLPEQPNFIVTDPPVIRSLMPASPRARAVSAR